MTGFEVIHSLAAPAYTLIGAWAGVFVGYRMAKGQPPPNPFARKPKINVEAPKAIETKPFPQPRVRA